MNRQPFRPTWVVVFPLLLGCLFCLSSCNSDLYATCTLDPTVSTIQSQCLNDSGASCVIKQQLQCQTRICAKYQGSQPFCTIPCQTDADCAGGVCREFVFQSGDKYCVEKSDVQN